MSTEGGSSSLPRYSVSSGEVKVKVEPTKVASQACVVMGLNLKVNQMVLLSLVNGTIYPFAGEDVDTTIVAYCAAQNIQKELLGNAQASAASKVTSVNVGCDKGEFLVSAVCDRTGTSAKKVAGLMAKNLKFSTLGQQYKTCCAMLSIKSDNDGFAYAVNSCNAAVFSGLNVVVTGRVNLTNTSASSGKDKATAIADAANNKIKDLLDKPGAKKRYVENTNTCHDKYFEQRLPSGLEKELVREYMDSSMLQFPLMGGVAIIPEKMMSHVEKLNDKDKIGRFVAKLDRVGDNLSGMLSYNAAVACSASTSSLSSNKDFKVSELKSILSSAF